MATELIVHMGELIVVTRQDNILVSLGLGSCIGICAYDSVKEIGAMAHVVLPATVGKVDGLSAKSADIAIPNLIKSMVNAGADKNRIRIAIAGGAQLFSFAGIDSHMNIGQRNIEAVTELLESARLKPQAADVGGTVGRTMRFTTSTGMVTIRRVGEVEEVLANLSKWERMAA